MIEGAPINVFDFMTEAQRQDVASGTGALDVTAALVAALNAAKAIPFSEKEMVFPAGLYRVTQFDFTSVVFCTFRALGTVQIYGNGTEDFIFGCDGYNPADPPASVSSNNNIFTGGKWLIANTGGTYLNAVRLTHCVNSSFENFSVSGIIGSAVGDKVQVYINYAWVNTFTKFDVGAPGTPNAGARSICIANNFLTSTNNFNNNVFDNCRIAASSVASPYTDTVGFILGGNANTIRVSDISALDVGIELIASQGFVADTNYYEFTTTTVSMPSGNSTGSVFIGGIYEVITNGTTFNLTSSQQTTIIGGKYFGISGGSNRTFINQGIACYGLSVISPNLLDIDNQTLGTYHNPDTLAQASVLQAKWFTFPANSIASSDPNTIDEYEEGSWTPVKPTGTAFTSATGKYTKIGNQVTATFIVEFAVETNGAAAQIASFPFSATGTFSERNGLALGYNTSSTNVGGALSVTTLTLQKVGAGGGGASITNMSGATLSGTVTYLV